MQPMELRLLSKWMILFFLAITLHQCLLFVLTKNAGTTRTNFVSYCINTIIFLQGKSETLIVHKHKEKESCKGICLSLLSENKQHEICVHISHNLVLKKLDVWCDAKSKRIKECYWILLQSKIENTGILF